MSHKYAGEGTEEAPYVVEWLEKDEENPMNWSSGYKWWATFMVSTFTFCFTFGSSAYAAALGSVEADYPGYIEQVYICGLVLYVAGFALGPMAWAPLSELYGRRIVFLISYAGYVAFNGGVIGCQNVWSLAIVRFFAGLSGSSVLTNSGGTISDLFTAKQRGVGIALFAFAPFAGPSVGPLVGGFLSDAAGWRWVAALICLLSGVEFLLGAVCMPETYAPTLLKRRAERLSVATGQVYRSRYESTALSPRKVVKRALIRPFKLLFIEPIVMVLTIYLSIVYGTLYLLFEAFPIVFQQQRGWSAGVSGLAFLGLLAGFVLALLWQIFGENRRYSNYLRQNNGVAPPEQRLVPGAIGGLFLTGGMFWFAWTAAPVSIPWIVPILACVPFGFGMVLVFLSVLLYLIDAYLIYAASVSASNSFMRSFAAVAFPLFAVNMYEGLGINWASTLLAFMALACVPFPFIFIKWGASIRSHCKYSKKVALIMAPILAQQQQQQQKKREADAAALSRDSNSSDPDLDQSESV